MEIVRPAQLALAFGAACAANGPRDGEDSTQIRPDREDFPRDLHCLPAGAGSERHCQSRGVPDRRPGLPQRSGRPAHAAPDAAPAARIPRARRLGPPAR
ncbi:hypothetical protein G6F56_014510 [Rhizopus delemar]|nr:hypothetical protein G6F56_014510 [Rhizopus delemar]